MELNKEKLIFISLTDSAGGAEQILLMSANVNKSKLIFLKQASSSALYIDSQTNISYLNRKSLLWGFVLLIKELLKYREGYTLMSSHSYLNAYLGILKRIGFLKSKLVTRECTSVFLRFTGLKKFSYKFVYTLGYPGINLMVCQTSEMKKQLLENLSFLADKQVIVEKNPVDVQLVLEKSELKIHDSILGSNYICSAGRLMTLKGFDKLIMAFSQSDAPQNGIKLLILGEGEERKNLENLIIKLNLQDEIILKGFVSNPFPYFKNARLCVVSSVREGFPNVLLQMMTLNKCVISTLCADGIELFDSVVKVKVNDVGDLAKAINTQLAACENLTQNKNMQYISSRSPNNFISSILRSASEID